MAKRDLSKFFRNRLFVEGALVSVVAIYLWVRSLALVGDAPVDDAYITFAYSKNVALGNGPIYGHDLKVEGYSNFLWMMLVALGELVGAGAMATARFLSSGFFALTLASTWWIARRWGGSFAAFLVVICLASFSDFYRAIQSGLETVAFAGLLAAGIAHYLVENPTRRRWSMVWFAAAGLTRIDGFVPLALLLGLEGIRWAFEKQKAPLKQALVWLGIGVGPLVVYWAWRASYYGLAFPLTYYAKASMGIEADLRGSEYLWTALRDTGAWIALLGAGVGLFRNELRLYPLQILAFVVLMAGYVVHVGGDWIPFNRMLLPLVAPLLMVFAAGMGRALQYLKEAGRVPLALGAALCAAACIFMGVYANDVSVDTPQEKGKLDHAAHVKRHTQSLLEALPFIVAMIRKPGDTLVTDYGGVFAYGTEARVIEMWGLANRDIALRGNTDGINPIYGKTCVPCYAQFDPDYFHSVTPLLRSTDAFGNQGALISQIFQGRAIDQVLDFRRNFVMGRVVRPQTGEALWFLEKKRDGVEFTRRRVGEFVIDYPQGRRRPPSGRPPRAREESGVSPSN